MSLRKIITTACFIGIGISVAGFALIALGGWGPCGPKNAFSALGGALSMAHVAWLMALFPGLDALSGRFHADLALVLVWPAVVWSALAFAVLVFLRRLNKRQGQSGMPRLPDENKNHARK